MQSKSKVEVPETFGVGREPVALSRAIRADEFDQFIEGQLRKKQLISDKAETDIVCHVY
jgi:hypothetical protein